MKKLTKTQQRIIAAKQAHPEATERQIAEIADTGHGYVHEVLQQYNINYQSLQQYRDNQADILLGLQQRIVSSITEQDIAKASLQQRVTSLGIAHDKEQALRGNSKTTQPLVIINIRGADGELRQANQAQHGDVIDV